MSETIRQRLNQIELMRDVEAARHAYDDLLKTDPKTIKGSDLGIRAINILNGTIVPNYIDEEKTTIRPFIFKAPEGKETPTLDGFIVGATSAAHRFDLTVGPLSFSRLGKNPVEWISNSETGSSLSGSLINPGEKAHAAAIEIYPYIPKNIGRIAVFEITHPEV